MQTTNFIISCLSLAVSVTTLVVIVVGAKRANDMIAEVSIQAEEKVNLIKRTIADL